MGFACLPRTHLLSPELPAAGLVVVGEEVLVEAGLAVLGQAVAGRDGQQVDAQLVQRVTQQLAVVVQAVGGAARDGLDWIH